MILTTEHYSIEMLEALAADVPVAAGLLARHARVSADPQLPAAWHLEGVTVKLMADAWSTDHALQVIGTVVAD
jgi:hypothetical protein